MAQLKLSINHCYCPNYRLGKFQELWIHRIDGKIDNFIGYWFKKINANIKFSKWIDFWKNMWCSFSGEKCHVRIFMLTVANCNITRLLQTWLPVSFIKGHCSSRESSFALHCNTPRAFWHINLFVWSNLKKMKWESFVFEVS